eukprot:TRINITY_DN2335_c1_g1_i7.p2 TRINITY_DN2335_c1_g1~~TRINITY_DN2335_c1_g1_i7.p2  ORF type:complete len:223 (-),score=-22.28 TRINITY_DN2335_c1_g1_i7:83-751(-)
MEIHYVNNQLLGVFSIICTCHSQIINYKIILNPYTIIFVINQLQQYLNILYQALVLNTTKQSKFPSTTYFGQGRYFRQFIRYFTCRYTLEQISFCKLQVWYGSQQLFYFGLQICYQFCICNHVSHYVIKKLLENFPYIPYIHYEIVGDNFNMRSPAHQFYCQFAKIGILVGELRITIVLNICYFAQTTNYTSYDLSRNTSPDWLWCDQYCNIINNGDKNQQK